MAFQQLEIARQKITLSLIPPWSQEDILCDRTRQITLHSFNDRCLKSTFNSGCPVMVTDNDIDHLMRLRHNMKLRE